MEFISDAIFPNIDKEIISKMVEFSNTVSSTSRNTHLCPKQLLRNAGKKQQCCQQCICWFPFKYCIFSRLSQLVQEVSVDRKWGQRGGPWEFNLRDLFRWCQLMQADQSPGFFNPGQHVGLVYADRMRSEDDKTQVPSVQRCLPACLSACLSVCACLPVLDIL